MAEDIVEVQTGQIIRQPVLKVLFVDFDFKKSNQMILVILCTTEVVEMCSLCSGLITTLDGGDIYNAILSMDMTKEGKERKKR